METVSYLVNGIIYNFICRFRKAHPAGNKKEKKKEIAVRK